MRRENAKLFPRHCERSEAIHSSFARRDGLLRFARNDGGGWAFARMLARNDAEKANPDLIAPQLCGQYRGQNGRKSACLAAFSGVPALYSRTRSGFTVILPSFSLIP